MIAYVVKLMNFSAATIQGVFHVAWLIGKVIVDLLTGISSTLFNIIGSIVIFFQIIYEDNVSIFTEELPNFANNVVDTIDEQYNQLLSGIIRACYEINFKLSAIISTFKWLIDAVIVIICEVLLLIKNTVIFFGDTIWFILTFIPVHLPQLIRAFFKSLTAIIVDNVVDGYMRLLKITNFLTDVPLQSFMGIISAIAIIRLCVFYRESIHTLTVELYWSVVRKMWYYYYAFYNNFVDPEVREITRLSGEEDLTVREEVAAVVDDGSAADALCVICQERQKCVLTLPCRHVCLCTECCMRLYGYQRTCPICRTFIYHSVTVYL